MVLDLLFWAVCALAFILIAAAIVSALRRGKSGQKTGAQDSPMYASGVFSLIRRSPREMVMAKVPSLELIRKTLSHATSHGLTLKAGPEAYLAEWHRVAELCINEVEKGDREGTQTYRYLVPNHCQATTGHLGGDAYVTREQLHKTPELLPPFHLGCGCVIVGKEAWQNGSTQGGWTPVLPVNGNYPLPDWRTVVPF
jgi:hypothetical protein